MDVGGNKYGKWRREGSQGRRKEVEEGREGKARPEEKRRRKDDGRAKEKGRKEKI